MRPRRAGERENGGFSLPEVLVVIVIIAMLAGMLLLNCVS
jgi:prepilin-type N-terminal cleavage/methylation domain-containing protein